MQVWAAPWDFMTLMIRTLDSVRTGLVPSAVISKMLRSLWKRITDLRSGPESAIEVTDFWIPDYPVNFALEIQETKNEYCWL